MTRNLLKTLSALWVAGALLSPSVVQAQEELRPAVEAYNANQFDRAATYLYDYIGQSGADGTRAKAELYLAQSLQKMGLNQSALYFYNNIVREGPAHPYYVSAIEGIVDVSEALDDDLLVPSMMNREYNEEFARLRIEYQHKINYMVGLVSYRADQFEDAEAFLSAVAKENPYYARARYLLGLTQIQKGRRDGNLDEASKVALAYFNEVLGLRSSAQVQYTDLKDLRDLAELGMARTYYGLGEYASAVKHYENVPRFSPYWDQALFENGWARFLDDDFGGALGTLQALHAPQFAGAFAPESHTLKATVYYASCLFNEANAALTEFDNRYQKMAGQIEPLLADDREPAAYYAMVSRPDLRTRLPAAVYNYLAANKRVAGFKRYISALEAEKRTVQANAIFKNKPIQGEIIEVIDQQRNGLENIAGQFVKGRLADAVSMIQHFNGQAKIIRFETAKKEKELVLQGGEYEQRLASQALERPVIPAEDWEYWNFQGEYWIDEIGYYQFTLKNACPAE